MSRRKMVCVCVYLLMQLTVFRQKDVNIRLRYVFVSEFIQTNNIINTMTETIYQPFLCTAVAKLWIFILNFCLRD